MGLPYSVFRTTAATGAAPGGGVEGVASAATNYSTPWSISNGDGFSLHVEWTGTASGNLQLWYTNKPFPVLSTDADWDQDATFGTAGNVALGGAPGKFGDNVGNAKARWWRFKQSGGGGTGVISGWVTTQRTA
jgi:hypothetical protein